MAQQLAADCGGLCTPALRDRIGQPLNDRQREIIKLVAAGLSSKEIAERLVRSVRGPSTFRVTGPSAPASNPGRYQTVWSSRRQYGSGLRGANGDAVTSG